MKVYFLMENDYEGSSIHAVFTSKDDAESSLRLFEATRNSAGAEYVIGEYSVFDSAIRMRPLYKMRANINNEFNVIFNIERSSATILETDAPYGMSKENPLLIEVARNSIRVAGWDENEVEENFKSIYESKGLSILS